MYLTVLDNALSICRLPAETALPDWVLWQGFLSVTLTKDELSIVIDSAQCPQAIEKEEGWRAIKIIGPLNFSLTGILARLLTALANAQISIFSISTFDTDYVLVKEENLQHAIHLLKLNDYIFKNEGTRLSE